MQAMHWSEIVTAIATSIYTMLFFIAVRFAYVQTRGFEKNRKLQAALTIFKELQASELMEGRRYIYEQIPQDIKNIDVAQLKEHLQKVESSLIAFERIGYLVYEGHIDTEPIIVNYWPSIWRCWKKCATLIRWARTQRGEKVYFARFEDLFYRCEAYRAENEFEEPKFY